MISPSSPKPQPHQLSGTDETFQVWPVFSFRECLPLPHPPFLLSFLVSLLGISGLYVGVISFMPLVKIGIK